ncbi:MAG: MATE family efflux transporter [Solirubrobacteraceae bacterium]|nr:MATE family efflux transporter [Solirubrobacteraceae bacterium]
MSAATPPAPDARALDRRIVAIAVPALGSLIAEPLYLLVDAAIVGHLGARELAALGIATQVLLTIVSLCVFLAYGTTTAVARAAEARARAELGVQAAWLGAITGGAVAAGLLLFAGPLARGLGGDTPTAALAARYLQLAAIGVAAQLIAIAGQGWLRGREALGLALRLVVAAQLVNVVAELLLVYGLDLGLDGSAIGTVIAQLAMAAATLWLIVREARAARASRQPDWAALRGLASFGGLLFVRSVSLAGSYLLLSALAARISDPAMGAHLVATNLLWLGALALDALAIAAQVIVAGALGARDHAGARRAAAHVTMLSTGFGVLVGVGLWVAGPGLVASLFTDDASVAAAAEELWPWLCVVQTIGGVVFALDGILIGAEDGRILALSMAASAVALLVALAVVGTGSLDALWAALTALFVMRTATLAVRMVRGPLREGLSGT